MIQILKASAGSGKTYNLAREYIRLILSGDEPDTYRHVLAVTFTNKATDEMKRRILKELHTLAVYPQESKYLEDLLRSGVKASAQEIQRRAQQQLYGILHDYSAFAVSTIDRFFQQTLRAFSREIGQFSAYQVQLDREALEAESVDRVLDSLSEENRPLVEWLTDSVREEIQERGRFSLEQRLGEVAGSLRTLPEGEARFEREYLEALGKKCRSIEKDFESRVRDAAEAVLACLKAEGVDPSESNRRFLVNLYPYAEASAPVERPNDTFLEKASDSQKWFAKSKDKLRIRLEGVLEAPLQAFTELFAEPYRLYRTARTLRSQLYGLGVASELQKAFTDIQREKNVLSIDDSNTILRGIIDGTDTPFIYEKLGVRFEDFLLDEFQDTADIQWENFRPLVEGSESAGHSSLVVGDVKQSIYRWRGSDSGLLGGRLQQEFPRAQVRVLDENWRTCREIVGFNNEFFSWAAGQLDLQMGEDPASEGSISALYADVRQKIRLPDPAPGSVEVSFVEDQMEEILSTLAAVRERGGRWGDVAILVRGNAEGSAVAGHLVAEKIPVVSDDSLFVKSSVTVRRLLSRLSLVAAPPREGSRTVEGYLAGSLEGDLPACYHSLTDLAESLLRGLRASAPAVFDAEIPYILAFMDYLKEWTSLSGNNLSAFLAAFDAAEPKIASPEGGDAVRVMTIHKSKGLEFPFVIVPFAEKVTLYKASSHWCRPRAEGTPLQEQSSRYFRVRLDGDAGESFFREDYLRERKLEAIDNINVFYVALTRARYGLKVIAAPPPGSIEEWKNLSQLLYGFVKTQQYSIGEPYDLGKLKREAPAEAPLPIAYAPSAENALSRLRFSPEAADYFGADGHFGVLSSRRIRGNVLHGILSRVDVIGDLPAAVDAAVGSGELPASEREAVLTFLGDRIRSVQERGWFSPGVRVLREAPVIAPDGQEYRPDRVVVRPDGSVEIIDYKFGREEERYRRQVARYAQLYRGMGYTPVRACLWYLESGEITVPEGL